MKKPWVEHVAIRVKDLAWHLSFLQNALGMEVTEIQGDPKSPTQVWIGGIQLTKDLDYTPRPYTDERVWHIGIHVDNLDETLKTVQSYAEVKPFSNSPDQQYWIALPDGLVIELVSK